ncbi:MAG: tRNA-dihydrouridine synthase family protein [Opitutales bacterium]|nr:tRNA-dihydrouridine synthase family protein [Opitutales bacterium]
MSRFEEIFRTGEIPLYLAPMSGFTDIAFRELCKEHGADVLVSEFVQSEPLIRGRERTWRDVDFTPGQRPMGIQIFGANPDSMARAAALLENRLYPDFIDINFGCPARKVVEQNAGSGLLKDLPLLEKVARAVVSAVPATSVTAKMRLGWDSHAFVHIEAAKRLEGAGVRVLAVHGRTKAQGYSGEADWEKIAEVVRAVQIPVVGNGDIRDAETALRRVRETGVSGLMIGRGALGKPWLFSQIKNALSGNAESGAETPTTEAVFSTLLRYAETLAKTRGDAGTQNIRWLLARLHPFTYGVVGGKRVRAELASCTTLDDLRRLLEKN